MSTLNPQTITGHVFKRAYTYNQGNDLAAMKKAIINVFLRTLLSQRIGSHFSKDLTDTCLYKKRGPSNAL
jgi:hypothetical protein